MLPSQSYGSWASSSSSTALWSCSRALLHSCHFIRSKKWGPPPGRVSIWLPGLVKGKTTKRRTPWWGTVLDGEEFPLRCSEERRWACIQFNAAAAGGSDRIGVALVPAREAPISLRPQNSPEVGATIGPAICGGRVEPVGISHRLFWTVAIKAQLKSGAISRATSNVH